MLKFSPSHLESFTTHLPLSLRAVSPDSCISQGAVILLHIRKICCSQLLHFKCLHFTRGITVIARRRTFDNQHEVGPSPTCLWPADVFRIQIEAEVRPLWRLVTEGRQHSSDMLTAFRAQPVFPLKSLVSCHSTQQQ